MHNFINFTSKPVKIGRAPNRLHRQLNHMPLAPIGMDWIPKRTWFQRRWHRVFPPSYYSGGLRVYTPHPYEIVFRIFGLIFHSPLTPGLHRPPGVLLQTRGCSKTLWKCLLLEQNSLWKVFLSCLVCCSTCFHFPAQISAGSPTECRAFTQVEPRTDVKQIGLWKFNLRT